MNQETFRDPGLARALLAAIHHAADRLSCPLTFMEVCGTHTMAIYRHGLRALLPEQVRLTSGPGCPVCVTPVAYLDRALELARRPNVLLATFGDMARVPGSTGNLLQARAEGAAIRIVYSPLDALHLAAESPQREVVFLGVGFETTAPAVAATLLQARQRGICNFFVLCAHKTMPAPMAALSADAEIQIHGYLCPGHVSAIIGPQAYRPLAEDYAIPCVITGFEPLDVLQGLAMLIAQARAGVARVENQYRRIVRPAGNPKARRLMETVFEPCDTDWRGLGTLAASGLRLRHDFAPFDAEQRFALQVEAAEEPAGCHCGEILKGKAAPSACPHFATICTPDTPVGACMVSSEGTCAAAFRYGR